MNIDGKYSKRMALRKEGTIMGFKNSDKSRIEYLEKENRRLRKLCEEKDSFFVEMISDGMRHGSHLAAKHMADRKSYLKGK